MVHRTIDLHLGEAGAGLLINQICSEMKILPAQLERSHMVVFAARVHEVARKTLGSKRARFMAGTLERFARGSTQEITTAENADKVEKKLDKRVNEDSPEFTFDRFCIGIENRLAYQACSDLLDHKAKLVFIYGPVGSGKTHLLQAVAHRAANPVFGHSVLSLSYHRLKMNYLDAVKRGTVGAFHRTLGVDVLLIDDIQFLVGQAELQEDLFRIFNRITAAGGRIVLTSDRPPADLAGLSHKLREHVGSGDVFPIRYPDRETRVDVLKLLAKDRGWIVPEDVHEAISTRLQGNLRELKGGLTKVIAYAYMARRPPTPALVAELLA